ncbi:hypothetical protein BJ508DRAFT_310552 [Ascobolus immersus RN42]|uniref:Uncharacterized protein n=1 Tax=Ascobolus immersus RN42 TaxID=1160509 RepID=A0A3N4HT63_ASCIM|nr:hypothetical protein BJ508DRAFT_310552 [Ascobolus immersus RN42]
MSNALRLAHIHAPPPDPDKEGDDELHTNIATVRYFFTIDKKKPRKARTVFKLNPLLHPQVDNVVIPESQLFALVEYKDVEDDGSFVNITGNGRLGIIDERAWGGDEFALMGYVIDRGNKVLVSDKSPVFGNGKFDRSIYYKEEE